MSTNRKRFIMAGLAVLTLSFSAVALELPGRGTADTSSPEATLKSFVGYISSGNYDAALTLFNCAEKIDHFDFVQSVSSDNSILSPSSNATMLPYAEYRELNKLGMLSDAGSQIRYFTAGFLLSDKFQRVLQFGPGYTSKGRGSAEAENDAREFAEELTPKNLQALRLERMDIADPDTQGSAKYLGLMQQWKKIYGWDEIADYVIFYELDQKYFVGGAMLTRYGESWLIDSLQSFLLPSSANGNAERTTLERYAAKLESWKHSKTQ